MNRDDDRYITMRDITLHDLQVASEEKTILGFDRQSLTIFILLIVVGVVLLVYTYYADGVAKRGLIEMWHQLGISEGGVVWSTGVFAELGVGILEAGVLYGLLEMTWRQRQDRDLISSIATREEIAELHETIDEMRGMLAMMVESQQGGGGEPTNLGDIHES